MLGLRVRKKHKMESSRRGKLRSQQIKIQFARHGPGLFPRQPTHLPRNVRLPDLF
jgi:hypothetical protein